MKEVYRKVSAKKRQKLKKSNVNSCLIARYGKSDNRQKLKEN